MVTLECKNCGKTFETSNWRAKTQKYCSVACVGASQRGKPRPGPRSNKPTSVTLTCQQCGNTFSVSTWKAKGRKFCGVACAGEFQRGKSRPGTRVNLTCQQCGNLFEVPKNWAVRGRRKFCSWDCKIAHQRTLTGEKSARFGVAHTEEAKAKMAQAPKARGPAHHSWKGGRCQTHHGYTYIKLDTLAPETQAVVASMATKASYILEHRIVMALKMGRPLLPTEKVHHINGNKMDNRAENLQVFPLGGHSRKHREIDRQLSIAQKEIERLTAENNRLRSLLETYPQNG